MAAASITSTPSLLIKYKPRFIPEHPVLVKRTLPKNLVLNIAKNEEIEPGHVLGKYHDHGGIARLNLPKELGVSPQKAVKYLKKTPGSSVDKGEVLAYKEAILNPRVIYSPGTGIFESYDLNSGLLQIKIFPTPRPFLSNIYGIIEHVDTHANEIYIKTLSSIIQGVWGMGDAFWGELKILSLKNDPILASQLNPTLKDKIIVCGPILYKKLLNKAHQITIGGVVGGGISPSDYHYLKTQQIKDPTFKSHLPFLVLEGSGAQSIGLDLIDALKQYDGHFIILNGESKRIFLPSKKADSILALRKIGLPLQTLTKDNSLSSLKPVQVGANVRSQDYSTDGVIGKVWAIDHTETMLATGIQTHLVTVKTPHRKVKIPYQELELI